MRRSTLFYLALLALPSCTLIDAGHGSSDLMNQVSSLSAGARCRVTLQPVKEQGSSSSQLTYEGTVEGVSEKTLTLKNASIVATSRKAPRISMNMPVIDRYFSTVAIVEQSLDTPVTIPIARIEQLSRLEEMATTTGE